MIDASEDSSTSDQGDAQEVKLIAVSTGHTSEQSNNMTATILNATIDHEMDGEVMNFKTHHLDTGIVCDFS